MNHDVRFRAGGTTNDSFTYNQSDFLHATICGHQLRGHRKAAVMGDVLNAPYIPESTAAAAYLMSLPDIGRLIMVAGTGNQTVTVTSCEDFVGGKKPVRVESLNTVGTVTLQTSSGYNGGVRESIRCGEPATLRRKHQIKCLISLPKNARCISYPRETTFGSSVDSGL